MEIRTIEYKVEQFDGSYREYILRYGVRDSASGESVVPEVVSLKDEEGEECYPELTQYDLQEINSYLLEMLDKSE